MAKFNGKPGPGRPKGVPNKSTTEAKQFAERMMDADYIASLQRRLKAGKAPHMETLLAQYRWGKPKETVALEGANGAPLVFTLKLNDRVEDDEPNG